MTRTLTTASVEPANGTSWLIEPSRIDGMVRVDNAARSRGERRWYDIGWIDYGSEPGRYGLINDDVHTWAEIQADGPPARLVEGPSDLSDLVIQEVGR